MFAKPVAPDINRTIITTTDRKRTLNIMAKIRWGVLGAANIATVKVIPAMLQSDICEIVGIASRTVEKAQAAADELGIAKSYGSYESLLADAEIDAVYVPLPNHLHVPWSIKALEAGKHVLCEKPIGLTADEGQQLVDAGKNHPHLKLMEAFMFRHHPQWVTAKELVTSGKIGELRTIQSFFSYHNVDPQNYRNQVDAGGGGLNDIGCYPISLSRFLFDSEPTSVSGVVEYDPTFKTDRLASAMLDFGRGTSTFSCGMQLAPYQRVNIFGTTGRVEIEIPFNAPPDEPCKVWHETDDGIEEILFDICDQYRIQGDLFARAILDDTPVPTPIEDAVANMRVIEAIVRAAKNGTWEKL